MDNDAIREIFESFGVVSIRRMFGGKGIYVDGVIVALEVEEGELKLKVDAASAREFIEAGSTQWCYQSARSDRAVAMPYWSVPDDAFDDADEMARFARLAVEAGRRAAGT